jgi:hypothetical protein
MIHKLLRHSCGNHSFNRSRLSTWAWKMDMFLRLEFREASEYGGFRYK